MLGHAEHQVGGAGGIHTADGQGQQQLAKASDEGEEVEVLAALLTPGHIANPEAVEAAVALAQSAADALATDRPAGGDAQGNCLSGGTAADETALGLPADFPPASSDPVDSDLQVIHLPHQKFLGRNTAGSDMTCVISRRL